MSEIFKAFEVFEVFEMFEVLHVMPQPRSQGSDFAETGYGLPYMLV
jgi:hypothetical protein